MILAIAAVVVVGAVTVLLSARPDRDSLGPISASYPEGPLDHGGKLYFAEMTADRVSVVQDGGVQPFFDQTGCGPTAIAPYGLRGYIVLCHLGRRAVAVNPRGEERRRWEADADGKSLMDPNDASADGRGGVYFSDPGMFSRDTEPHGRLLHLAASGELRVVADTLWYPNGVYVDQRAEHLYVSEHLAGRVLRFEITGDGVLGPPISFARLADADPSDRYATPYGETGPDGLEMGPNGELYVAVYGEGRVIRFGRGGEYRGTIELPTRFATNIAFRPDGSAVTTGSFAIEQPPLRGEVRFHSVEAVSR